MTDAFTSNVMSMGGALNGNYGIGGGSGMFSVDPVSQTFKRIQAEKAIDALNAAINNFNTQNITQDNSQNSSIQNTFVGGVPSSGHNNGLSYGDPQPAF